MVSTRLSQVQEPKVFMTPFIKLSLLIMAGLLGVIVSVSYLPTLLGTGLAFMICLGMLVFLGSTFWQELSKKSV